MLLDRYQYDEQLNRALRQLYQSHGYRQYKVSKFEEYDLYVQNKRFLASEHILTFSDLGGRLMALKPDITFSIVKNRKQDAPTEKVFYTENVYRVPKNDNSFREILQTGLECVGTVDLYAMSEVLMLAARSLSLISADYVLDVSELGILSGVLADCGAEQRTRILSAFWEKNAHELAAACEGLPEETCDVLRALISLSGPLKETLERVKALPLPEGSAAAVKNLQGVAALLDCWGVRNVNLDFSVVDDMDYYNGLMCKGFVEGIPAAVLSGGRYDGLLAKMGKRGEAMGFAVYLDQLERFYRRESNYDFDTLLLYDADTDPALLVSRVEQERDEGRSVRAQWEAPPEGSWWKEIDLRKEPPCDR
ncbi:MAG: ATP phosphoribosyltransferase regulatory subunit [Oscillospiraceae bacterium]|nr:ATP phosphoribosyltransferase regulatory subunit [Oscillospiraceae bacterium]